jgi:hypothetical protein
MEQQKQVVCITKDRYFECEKFITMYRSGQKGWLKANLYNTYLGKDEKSGLHILKVDDVPGSTVDKTCWLTDEQFTSQFSFAK